MCIYIYIYHTYTDNSQVYTLCYVLYYTFYYALLYIIIHIILLHIIYYIWGFPHSSIGKESACNAGDIKPRRSKKSKRAG